MSTAGTTILIEFQKYPLIPAVSDTPMRASPHACTHGSKVR